MNRSNLNGYSRWVILALPVLLVVSGSVALAGPDTGLLEIMRSELDLSMNKLVSPDGTKPYFIQYSVTDEKDLAISASLGSVTRDHDSHSRQLEVDVRCGDYALDNTHQIRGGYWGGYDYWQGAVSLPLEGDPVATRHAIWLETDTKFKAAVKRLGQVKANVKVMVEEEDLSDDFSREDPSVHQGEWLDQPADVRSLTERIKKFSRRLETIRSSTIPG